MSRLRLLLFWLLVLAVPLQGFAATSKLLCGSAGALHAGATSVHAHAGGHHAGGPHEHADAAADLQSAPAPDLSAPSADGPAHGCGLCAACCHAVAAGHGYEPVLVSPAPRADLPELVARITTRGLRLPEKPPRG